MITITQYTRTYEAHQRVLQDEAKRIARSSTTRSWLMKNIGTAPDDEVIKRAVECIADLTGDQTLAKALVRRQPRVCQEPCQYREPPASKYNTTVDNGSTMLECPECKCRIQYNAFTYAVGTQGFSFCPYCGADVRKETSDGSDDDI